MCVGLVPDLGEYENRAALLTDAHLRSVYGDVQLAACGWVCAKHPPLFHRGLLWTLGITGSSFCRSCQIQSIHSRYPWFVNAMVTSVKLGALALLAFQVIGVLSSRKGTVQFALGGGVGEHGSSRSLVREGGCVQGIFVGCQPYQILGCSCTHVSCLWVCK